MIHTTIITINIISSVFLLVSILLQQRGSGLSASFGGGGQFYRTRRGIEKFLFSSTIVAAILFFGSALSLLFY